MAQPKLATYHAKRDFSRTDEPRGDARGEAKGLFIVQKHAARRLHYDLRLAHDGVLLSWAVTKGPSLDPADKRLAVRTEDHPMDYASFEGTIPKDQYGGGTVMLWDRGRFRVEGDVGRALAEGKLKIAFEGERLQGGFTLVRMKGKKNEKRENWLLIKERDETADETWSPDSFATSIATGRTMEEITSGAKPRSVSSGKGAKGKRATAKAASAKPVTAQGDLPDFISPQLATLAEEAPAGENWLHEVKYDGYRLLAAVDGAAVRLYTRSGLDWTDRFAGIAKDLARLGLRRALLDGEATAAGKGGSSDFSALQRALKEGKGDIAYFAFDLLKLGEEDLRELPQSERKERLKELLAGAKGLVRYSDHIRGSGDRVAVNACKMGLEGIISKRADAPYRSTRSRSWLKVKCVKRQEFVIGGFTPSSRGRPFSSLIVGVFEGDELHYAGRVGTGFDERTLDELAEAMKRRERKTSPFADAPAAVSRKAKWCTPDLVAEIGFAEFTDSGTLRHAVFVGLREDKPARSITMEKPKAAPATDEGRAAPAIDIRLTSPDKVLFPAMGITKRDLADYLGMVAPRMLPHLVGRPVSLVRCPAGRNKSCFFQKHVGKGMPEAFGKVAVSEKDAKKADYILVESPEALVSCAQIGALELHVWGSRRDRLEQPDRLVFDLDPGEDVPFAQVRKAARELAAVLEEAGLVSFPLVTGGKGVHIVVPLTRRHEWPTVSGFAKAFAQKMADIDPDRFVATMTKAVRGGKIFIDHFRNQRGSTAIAPYSPRAREGAPVAMPVTWKELGKLESAAAFSIASVGDRIAQPDPWADYDEIRQGLSQKLARKIGISL